MSGREQNTAHLLYASSLAFAIVLSRPPTGFTSGAGSGLDELNFPLMNPSINHRCSSCSKAPGAAPRNQEAIIRGRDSIARRIKKRGTPSQYLTGFG